MTAQVARASNPDGTTAMWVRDRLDGLWCDEDFAHWYPRDGKTVQSRSPLPRQTRCLAGATLKDLAGRQQLLSSSETELPSKAREVRHFIAHEGLSLGPAGLRTVTRS